MIQGNELLILLLAAGLWFFYCLNWTSVRKLSEWMVFLLSNVFLTTGWILTILEGFLWSRILNLLEHLAYTASSVTFAVWCCQVSSGRNRAVK